LEGFAEWFRSFWGGGTGMLWRSSPAIQHCRNRAAECEHLAELAGNPEAKRGYLRLANCWYKLAKNREFVERMDSFLGHLKE